MHTIKAELDTFTLEALPDLDLVTKGALELFAAHELPKPDLKRFNRPLVVGSGNAAATGVMLFDDTDAVFADESSYLQKLDAIPAIDGAYVISASGSKHAVGIIEALIARSIPTVLLTTVEASPAGMLLPSEVVHVYPKNREPYTYNTSTYLGMLLSKTNEDPTAIAAHIETVVENCLPQDLGDYDAFFFILPERFAPVKTMFETKFDELFGPKLMRRIFTYEQTKHAKTVVPSAKELFISFGEENTVFGEVHNRVHIPLPEDANYGAVMAIGYVVIGHIQKQFPPYFKERVEAYAKETSAMFGSTINPIVE